jgi:formylglycine-generating enzyme required for sulfatase activity
MVATFAVAAKSASAQTETAPIGTDSKGRPLPHNAGTVKIIGNIEFVYIEGGEFIMGSPYSSKKHARADERPQHRVIVSSFWIGKYEVTQEQYKAIMKNNPSKFKGKTRPVEKVSWDDAMEFCNKFKEKYNVKVRLPFEAEWESACRAGSTTEYYWGEEINGDYCWYDTNSDRQTHPVGLKKPNRFGLYDMTGNVWEWCMDWYDENYYKKSPLKDPRGPAFGRFKVLRGRGWDFIHSPNRRRSGPVDMIGNGIGFRIALSEQIEGKK